MKRTELPRAEALCARYLDKNQPVLAAVSGGLDSMCLLHFLRGEGYDVSCAHFNHQLRGEEAARDEDFVRAWCEKEGIPFYPGTGDVRAHARATGKTEEEAGRDLRYAFLRETAQMLGAQIALAHHADDNAETVLLNFVRGTDLRGLCGMRPKQGDIVRPFLEQTREELVTYARAHNIPHVEDHTNADPNAAARNYLRLEILPRLRELNPRAPQHIATTARSLTALDDALDELLHRGNDLGDGSGYEAVFAVDSGEDVADRHVLQVVVCRCLFGNSIFHGGISKVPLRAIR